MWEMVTYIAALLSTPALALSYLPQIIKLIKSKNADGISVSFWLILDVSLLSLFILAVDTFIKTGIVSLLIAQSLNLALSLVTTVLVLYYKNKPSNSHKPIDLTRLGGKL